MHDNEDLVQEAQKILDESATHLKRIGEVYDEMNCIVPTLPQKISFEQAAELIKGNIQAFGQMRLLVEEAIHSAREITTRSELLGGDVQKR